MTNNSKTYCPLPFMAVDSSGKRFSPCCFVDKKIFQKYKTIESYYNSTELQQLQQNLKNNIKDPACHRCWSNEKNNLQSMRQSVLADRTEHSNKIEQVKLHVGRTCNLACMMCFPSISTTWNKLWKKDSPEDYEDKPGTEYYDEYIEQYIKKNVYDIKYIETLGGEPLFSKRFLKLLEWIIKKDQAKNITLYIITNFTIFPNRIIQLCKSFKKVIFTVSLEGIGLVNDYIRWGSKFNNIDNHIKTAIKNNFDVCIVPTINSLNIHRLNEIYQYAESNKILVMNPSVVKGWYSLLPNNLPKYLHQKVDIKFKSLLQGSGNEQSLKKFIINWDKQRNISILDYMPEFKELLDA